MEFIRNKLARIKATLTRVAPLTLVATSLAAKIAHAQIAGTPTGATPSIIGSVTKVFGLDFWSLITEGIADFFTILQMGAAWILAAAGTLLNYSINLTLHIHDFLNQTPAVYTAWAAIRDISNLFIIFFLLYAAMKMILGFDAKFGELIKNIVIAGVLINFSFFVAGLGIDASNIVSVQLYNAIAPANSLNANGLNPSGVGQTLADGGISNIFMSALKITSLYNPANAISSAATTTQAAIQQVQASNGSSWTSVVNIILIGITSIIIMITAAISFTLASAAFIIRFILLIFLLAFSPIWFAAHIVPEIKTYSDKWIKHYKNMLIFMPVYLLLMYVALVVLTSTGPLGTGNTLATTATPGVANGSSVPTQIIPPTSNTSSNTSSGSNTTPQNNFNGLNMNDSSLVASAYAANTTAAAASSWYGQFVSLAVNAVIVIFFLNLPLVAGLSLGGVTTEWIDTKKWGAKGIWKWTGNRAYSDARQAGGRIYQNTVSRAASKVSQSEGLKNLASKSKVVGSALRGTRAVAADYDAKLKEQIKNRTEFAESLGHDQRAVNAQLANITRARANIASGATTPALGQVAIRAAQTNIESIKNARKENYANRINTRSYDTLWMKIARKNKIAAAKVQGDVLKKRLETATKASDKIRDDIKSTENQLEGLKNKIMNQGGTANTQQATKKVELERKLADLKVKEAPALETVATLETRVAETQNIT